MNVLRSADLLLHSIQNCPAYKYGDLSLLLDLLVQSLTSLIIVPTVMPEIRLKSFSLSISTWDSTYHVQNVWYFVV